MGSIGHDLGSVFASLDHSSVPISLADPAQDDCPLVFVNGAFEQLTGYSASEITGRNCRFLQGPDTDPEAVTNLRNAIAQRKSISQCLLNYRADGTHFHNMLFIDPFTLESGTTLIVGCQYEFKVTSTHHDVVTHTQTLSDLLTKQKRAVQTSSSAIETSMRVRSATIFNLIQHYLAEQKRMGASCAGGGA